jgi:hypothetical protein
MSRAIEQLNERIDPVARANTDGSGKHAVTHVQRSPFFWHRDSLKARSSRSAQRLLDRRILRGLLDRSLHDPRQFCFSGFLLLALSFCCRALA